MLNTIVAESLRRFADELESAEDFTTALNALIKRTISEHKRIIFNGNGYDEAWVEEAKRRGLSNYSSAAEAIPHLLDAKNVEVMTRHGIYTEREMQARCEIKFEAYCKTLGIEAVTMLDMARTEILPAVFRYSNSLAEGIAAKKSVGASAAAETALLEKISALTDSLYRETERLDAAYSEAQNFGEDRARELTEHYRKKVIPAMQAVRADADALEVIVEERVWPFPTYGTLLYRI